MDRTEPKIDGNEVYKGQSPTKTATEIAQQPEMMQITKEEWDKVQAQLKMLYEVSDKSRVMSYESRTTTKKPLKVKLSRFQGGIIVGWRTIKDQGIYHPQTGKQIGEEQEYEILIDKDGEIKKVHLNNYPAFSAARYTDRFEAEVKGKKEDWDGKLTFDLALPDGRVLSLDSRFVN